MMIERVEIIRTMASTGSATSDRLSHQGQAQPPFTSSPGKKAPLPIQERGFLQIIYTSLLLFHKLKVFYCTLAYYFNVVKAIICKAKINGFAA